MGNRLSIVAVAAALTLAACGATHRTARPTHTTPAPAAATAPDPELVASCSGAGPGWRALAVRAHGARLNAAVLGHGDPGVVLANQGNNDPCAWMPFARELAGKGMRALVFKYDDKRRSDLEVLAAGRALRAAGARHVAVMGASLGGRAVVEAAARDRGTLAAAVTLSAERKVGKLPEILPLARRIRVPSLYIGSRGDRFTRLGDDTRQFHRVTPAKVNQMLLVPGGDHGVALLSNATGSRVRAAIFAFLLTNAR